MQAFQQALAVQAQIEFFSIDHHTIKKRIHWRTQGSQRLQRRGVVARLPLALGLWQRAWIFLRRAGTIIFMVTGRGGILMPSSMHFSRRKSCSLALSIASRCCA